MIVPETKFTQTFMIKWIILLLILSIIRQNCNPFTVIINWKRIRQEYPDFRILEFLHFKVLDFERAFAEILSFKSETWLAHLKEGPEICAVVYYEGILIWI